MLMSGAGTGGEDAAKTYVFTSSAFHDWSIEQSVSVPTFLGQLQTGCKWLRTKYTRIHLSTEWDCFFPENWTDFLFQELPEEIQSKIVYIYSVINEYSLRSRDVHSTPSSHKWSDFEYRPWCLAIVVRTPPGIYLLLHDCHSFPVAKLLHLVQRLHVFQHLPVIQNIAFILGC